MKTLTLKDILYIHESTIKKHGGTNGIKSLDLIRSSLMENTYINPLKKK